MGLLAAVVWAGRRGDERSAFILTVAAALALSPIVWLHYFALLLIVVALAQPTLGLVWFVPLAMVVTPGSGHPTPFETGATLAIAALTIALALRTSRRGGRRADRCRVTCAGACRRRMLAHDDLVTLRARRSSRPGSVAARVDVAIWVRAMVGWTAVLFALARDAFVTFRVGRFDLGNMVQAVWSTSQGRPLESTHGATGEQMVRLGGHADPFLVLLAPLWMLWPSPLSLAFAQIAVVSLGALPVFWLGRRHLGDDRVAGLLALGYLAYPWVATSAFAAIHPVTFAIPLFLFCVWFLDTDRLVPFAVCALLAMSTGELMGLPIVGLGIWFAFARGRRAAGALIALAGFAWTFVAVYVIVPAFADGDSIFFGFYDHVGGSPQGVIRMLFSDPGAVLAALFEGHDLVYLVWLGLPLLFLFVLSPGLALVAIPQLLANGLSDFRSMTDPRYHSVAAVIPFLIAATVFGVARVRAPRRVLAAAGVLICSACSRWRSPPGAGPSARRRSVGARASRVRASRRSLRPSPRSRTMRRSSRRTRPERTSRRADTSTPSRTSDGRRGRSSISVTRGS